MWVLTNLQFEIRSLESEGYWESEALVVCSYRLVTDGVKYCLFVMHEAKGFHTTIYNMQGTYESSSYYEYCDPDIKPGEPATDPGIDR